ncbi:50S ribosomal protein L9 [Cognatilysobacter terrigena]|uniref:50S ribosomal protein L9 n=1 Tax=Cognatilysobacter terrigena TaxID=2488749 RepID=UPI00106119D4|nr:50S ribosomal protein L9 [Lysobacter terrigena]
MQLILLQNVTNLGKLGDKVNVKPGYGRNFLVPQGKAVPATASNLADFEARRAEFEAKAKAQLEGAEKRSAELEGVEVTITANASAEGKLFGSVTPRDIAEQLTKLGHKVDKSEVVMGEGPFRRVGEYEVVVRMHADVEQPVKVVVVGEAA